MNTVVVGDIHGCLREFKMLLDQVQYEQGTDRLILLGDLVERGPDSAGVVKHAREIGAELVLGNHDNKLIRYWGWKKKCAASPTLKNPMKYHPEREGILVNMTEDDLAYLAQAKPWVEIKPGWIAVHAGVLPNGSAVTAQNSDVLSHVRYVDPSTGKMLSLQPPKYEAPEGGVPWQDLWRGPEKIVYGHWVSEPGTETSWAYPTDFGCVFGRHLGAWVFNGKPEPQLALVKALEEYNVYGHD